MEPLRVKHARGRFRSPAIRSDFAYLSQSAIPGAHFLFAPLRRIKLISESVAQTDDPNEVIFE